MHVVKSLQAISMLQAAALRCIGWGIAAVFAVSLLMLTACEPSAATVEVQFTMANGKRSPTIKAELARTPGEQQRGLMYRKTLAQDGGMLFIFPEEAARSFWMKNTYVELDIIYLDRDRKVVSIAKRAVPLSETARPSEKPAQYVLEVNGGLSDVWGLAVGDELEIRGNFNGK